MKRVVFAALALLLAACDEPVNIHRSSLPGDDPDSFRSEWSTAPPNLPVGQAFEFEIVKLDRGFDTSTWERCSGGQAKSTDPSILAVDRMTDGDRWLASGVSVGPATLVIECRDTKAQFPIEVTGSRRR
jgi:hypothetical protein